MSAVWMTADCQSNSSTRSLIQGNETKVDTGNDTRDKPFASCDILWIRSIWCALSLMNFFRMWLVGCYSFRMWLVDCYSFRMWLVGCYSLRMWLVDCYSLRMWLVGCYSFRMWLVDCYSLRMWLVGCYSLRMWLVDCYSLSNAHSNALSNHLLYLCSAHRHENFCL